MNPAPSASTPSASADLLARLARIVGGAHLLTDGERLRPHTEELRRRFASECLAVALPADAAQVAAVIDACAGAGVSIVPQGGNTGAVGGAVARRGQVIVNLARMNRIVEIDADNYTMEVEAGCILADIQAAAAEHERLFPLSLGAQGSCQIGGNLATNAGGINVLRYGNARDLALGVQVALADGGVWNGLNRLRKNNSGYDLKNLFIGAEGTLGIITAATLKLFPAPRCQAVALAGLRDADAALALLNRLRAASDDRLAAFELMAEIAVQSAVAHIHAQTDPLAARHRWYALIVANSANAESDLRRQIESCLADALRDDVLQDAVIASNETQAQQLILLRERIVEAQKFEGGSIKHDVSVPVAAVPEFLRRAHAALAQAMPDARAYPYGHMGDGNLHFNISQPPRMDTQKFLAQWTPMNRLIHQVAADLNGSFSAEHGIGLAKLEEMKRYKDPLTLSLYRRLKQTLDPDDVLNPGKVNP
ncbi:MAG: FAD-binding oxidoreductase [bacterium]